MKKTKKALASLALAGMVTSLVPMSVFGADAAVTRIAGASRIETAIAIAANGWTSADSVIVVPADDANIVDALAAAPLAGKLNAPILMTYKGELDAQVKAKITELKAKNVYAVGALSSSVVTALKGISGVSVTALQGADRTETAALVAAQLASPAGSFVVAYNGVADAMSAASFAAANNYAILIANPDGTLPANEAAYKGAKTYTVGGQVTMAGATALAGADRYETNTKVIDGLTFTYDKIYVANGESLVDALAGAPLAAKTKSPIVLASADKAATGANDNVSDKSAVIALGGSGAVSDAVRGQVTNKPADTNPGGPVAVSSVTATAANTMKVVFTAAPADTTKVKIDLARGTTPIPATLAWNAAKTEATVTAGYSLPEGTYTVAVKNDTTDLGSKSVAITQQKVAKIEITSTKLAVSNAADGSKGYASFKVYDQYNNDITNSYLANGISFTSGVGAIVAKDGALVLSPTAGLNLITFSTVVISASDSTSGTSASATLSTSTAIGTLSDLKLNKITNVENKEITAGDTTSVFYIDYTATDLSGNPTKEYKQVKNGLILSGQNGDELTTSNSYVTARVIQDPADDTKAAIEVKVTNGTSISMDLPLTITGMTYTGTSSAINTTFKKSLSPDTITLMAPAYEIAVNETKEIPFEVRDQAGTLMTKYADIVKGTNAVTLNGATWYESIDGTAKIFVTAQPTKGPQIITATTQTGKLSTITLNIVEAAASDALTIDSNKLVTAVQVGATQRLDNGYFYGGVTVKDQYGRAIDMKTLATFANEDGTASNVLGNQYEVYVFSSDPTIIDVKGSAADDTNVNEPKIATGRHIVAITAKQAGTANVNFYLVKKGTAFTKDAAAAAAVSTKSVSMSVIKDDDITSYTLETVPNAIYAVENKDGVVSAREASYGAAPRLYGKTNSGTKVLLANPGSGTKFSVMDVYTDSTDFATVKDNTVFPALRDGATKFGDYNAIYVVGKELDPSKTEATANLTVSFTGVDNKIYSLTTPIKSSTATPVAKNIFITSNTEWAGQSLNTQEDTLTVDRQLLNNKRLIAGMVIGRGAANGNVPAAGRGFHFRVLDSYGSVWSQIAQFSVSEIKNETTGAALPATDFVVAADGVITTNNLLAMNDKASVKVTAITNNGLIKTVKFVFKGNAVGAVVVDKSALTTAIAAANAKAAVAVAGAAVGQYPAAAIATYQAAITTAQAVVNNAAATAANVADAVTALNAATTTFDAAKVVAAGTVTGVTGTSAAAAFGSNVTINVANAAAQNVVKYVVYDADGTTVISAEANVGTVTTVFPAKAAGAAVKVKFLDAAGAAVGGMVSVTLQ